MLSEDGGVCTISLNVRRSRSRRGVFPGGMPVSRFAAARLARFFATFFATFFAAFFAVFFAVFCAAGGLAFGHRSTPRLLYHVPSAGLRRYSNLDSLPISVVRSDAYRNFGKP